MGNPGVCTVCGAEEIAINDDEMCEDCATMDGGKFKDEDSDVPEGMIEEEN